jgi:hypothetical protein
MGEYIVDSLNVMQVLFIYEIMGWLRSGLKAKYDE